MRKDGEGFEYEELGKLRKEETAAECYRRF